MKRVYKIDPAELAKIIHQDMVRRGLLPTPPEGQSRDLDLYFKGHAKLGDLLEIPIPGEIIIEKITLEVEV